MTIAEPPEIVTRAWSELAEHWDDQTRHDALLGLVAKHDCYAWAAVQYKARGDDPIAARQLERIRKALFATMMLTASRKPDAGKLPFKGSILVLAIVVILSVVGMLYLQFRQARTAHPTQSQPR
ncbi:MAG TPA: hypothetical protein VGG28_13545 [Kofleriaceae bacterium]|jgi:hypothetical protein